QPSAPKASSVAAAKGPRNDTTPIEIEAQKRSLKSSGSTSAPARNVSTTDAKLAMNTSQLALGSRSKVFPSTTPRVSSTSATEMPASTEMRLATSTAPAKTAASWTGSNNDLLRRPGDVHVDAISDR